MKTDVLDNEAIVSKTRPNFNVITLGVGDKAQTLFVITGVDMVRWTDFQAMILETPITAESLVQLPRKKRAYVRRQPYASRKTKSEVHEAATV